MKKKLIQYINGGKYLLYNNIPYKSRRYQKNVKRKTFLNLLSRKPVLNITIKKQMHLEQLLQKKALRNKFFTHTLVNDVAAWHDRRELQNDVTDTSSVSKRLDSGENTMNLSVDFKNLNKSIMYDKNPMFDKSQEALQESLMREVFVGGVVQKTDSQDVQDGELYVDPMITQIELDKPLRSISTIRDVTYYKPTNLKVLKVLHKYNTLNHFFRNYWYRINLINSEQLVKTFPRTLRWKAICLSRKVKPLYWQQRRTLRKTTESVKSGLKLTTILYNEYKWSNHEFINFVNAFDDGTTAFIIDYTYLKYLSVLPNTVGNSNMFFRKKLDYVTHVWNADSTALSNVIGAPNYIFNKKFYNFFDTKALKYKHFFFTNADVEQDYNQNKLNSLSKRFKVDFTKSTAWFINRFVIHGKQRKSAKAFATALAWFNIFSKMQTVEYSQLHNTLNNNFILRGGVINNALNYTRAQYKFATPINTNVQRLVDTEDALFFTFSSGQHILRRLWFMSPLYIMYVKRVDKRRYKNSRGKSGRYEMVLCRINKRRRIPLCLQTVKYDWVSHGDRTFATRFFRILYLMFLNPEGMYCHNLSAKALFKYNERL